MSKEEITRVTIPAAPEWYVAFLVEAGANARGRWDDRISLHPVIAWEIERSDQDGYVGHGVIPIIGSGNVKYHGHWAIKGPDGKFTIPTEGVVLENEADLIVELKALRKPRKTA